MRCLYLALCLVLGAAESSAAPELLTPASSFRFSLQDQQKTVLSKCVATAVSPTWLITAAHCLHDQVTELIAICPEDQNEPGTRHAVSKLVFHAEFDLVLLQLEALPHCVTALSTIAEQYPELAEITSAGIAPGLPTDPISFETVQREESTLVLLDADACLSRGDSGYPLYIQSNHQLVLLGVLIGGTEDCPGYQQVIRLDQHAEWIRSTVEPAECAPGLCLEVHDSATLFCSIDPPGLDGLANLNNKSRLWFASGNYSLTQAEGGSLPPMSLETLDTQTQLWVGKSVSVNTISPLSGSQFSQKRLEVLSIYTTSGGDTVEVQFRAMATSKDQVFRLDINDAESYWSKGLNLSIKTSNSGTILYAPCSLLEQPDQLFVFELANGLRVTATVRAAVGSYELGFYIGRLLRGQVESRNTEVDVTHWSSLSYMGSSLNQGELNAPGLVVRTPRDNHGCGFVFDPADWDTDQAVNGYYAYRLSCNGALSERLTLTAVEIPQGYVFP